MLVEPAIEMARQIFLGFSGCTTVKMRVLFKELATTINNVEEICTCYTFPGE